MEDSKLQTTDAEKMLYDQGDTTQAVLLTKNIYPAEPWKNDTLLAELVTPKRILKKAHVEENSRTDPVNSSNTNNTQGMLEIKAEPDNIQNAEIVYISNDIYGLEISENTSNQNIPERNIEINGVFSLLEASSALQQQDEPANENCVEYLRYTTESNDNGIRLPYGENSTGTELQPDAGNKETNNGIKQTSGNDNSGNSTIIMFKWGSKNKPFRCQICDMSFSDGTLLRIHLDKHESVRTEPIRPFPCNFCTKSFQSLRSLERHQFIHSGQSQKRCKFCYKVFANKENLDKHILLHNTSKTPPESQTNYQGLEMQLTCPLPLNNQKWFKCEICEKLFSRKGTLDRHMYTHKMNGKDKHRCVECGKSFLFLFALKKHVRALHSEEPDGENCKICGKYIRNRGNISRHMLIHEGIRPFECPTCGRKFTQKQHLIDHLVTHTTSLPFECQICKLAFRFKRSLNRHLKKHYKVLVSRQQLQCVECGSKQTNESEMLNHIRAFHFEMKTCYICQALLSSTVRLYKHLKEKHDVDLKLKSVDDKSTETDPVDARESVAWQPVARDTNMDAMQNNVEKMNEIPNQNPIIVNFVNDVTVCEDAISKNRTADDVISKNRTDDKIAIYKTGDDGVNTEIVNEENVGEHSTTEGDVLENKEQIESGEQVIYILYDNGQEVVQKVIEQNGVYHIDGTEATKTEYETGHVATYSLDGTQLVQIAQQELQDDGERGFENTAEIVELIQIAENEKVEENIDDGSEIHVSQTVNSDNVSEDSLVNHEIEGREGESNFADSSKFVTDRSELIQSVLDYAEKIQEEELSMINNETKL